MSELELERTSALVWASVGTGDIPPTVVPVCVRTGMVHHDRRLVVLRDAAPGHGHDRQDWQRGVLLVLPAGEEEQVCGCGAPPYGACSHECTMLAGVDYGTAGVDCQASYPAPVVFADSPPAVGWADLDAAERYLVALAAAITTARRIAHEEAVRATEEGPAT